MSHYSGYDRCQILSPEDLQRKSLSWFITLFLVVVISSYPIESRTDSDVGQSCNTQDAKDRDEEKLEFVRRQKCLDNTDNTDNKFSVEQCDRGGSKEVKLTCNEIEIQLKVLRDFHKFRKSRSFCNDSEKQLKEASAERDSACRAIGDGMGGCTDPNGLFARCEKSIQDEDSYSSEDISEQCPYFLQDKIDRLKGDSQDLSQDIVNLRDEIRLYKDKNGERKKEIEDKIQKMEEKALEADAKGDRAASRVREELAKAYGRQSKEMNDFTKQLRELIRTRDSAKADLYLLGDVKFLDADINTKQKCFDEARTYAKNRSHLLSRSRKSASHILSLSKGDPSSELARIANSKYAKCMQSQNSLLLRGRNQNRRLKDIEIASYEEEIVNIRRLISEANLKSSAELRGIEEKSHSDSLAAYQEAQAYREEAARLKLSIQSAGSQDQQEFSRTYQEYMQKRKLKQEKEKAASQLEKHLPRGRNVSGVFGKALRAVGKHESLMEDFKKGCCGESSPYKDTKYCKTQGAEVGTTKPTKPTQGE